MAGRAVRPLSWVVLYDQSLMAEIDKSKTCLVLRVQCPSRTSPAPVRSLGSAARGAEGRVVRQETVDIHEFPRSPSSLIYLRALQYKTCDPGGGNRTIGVSTGRERLPRKWALPRATIAIELGLNQQ